VPINGAEEVYPGPKYFPKQIAFGNIIRFVVVVVAVFLW